tara:strand:+ start:64 stop:693 length:630 start_codon:yes stop_codon:yes gene_type:complete
MKIVLCIPGDTFLREVMLDVINFIREANALGWNIYLQSRYSANIYKIRNEILGGNKTLGKEQKPFNGKVDYDYVLWIDSDIRFNITMIETLLSHKKDVITGLYRMKDSNNFVLIEDKTYFSNEDLQKKIDENNMGIFPISTCGLGICLMSRKALESIEYPWFRPIVFHSDKGLHYSEEDTGICIRLRGAGFTIYCDPNVIAGHMKMIMI